MLYLCSVTKEIVTLLLTTKKITTMKPFNAFRKYTKKVNDKFSYSLYIIMRQHVRTHKFIFDVGCYIMHPRASGYAKEFDTIAELFEYAQAYLSELEKEGYVREDVEDIDDINALDDLED